MKHFLNSFRYAMSGIVFCVKYERNMRIHVAITLYVLYFAGFYELTRSEVILLILTCVSAITLEMVNTALEVVIDKVSPSYHTLAKIGKDVAAGAVLIATIAAVIIGILLFWDVEVFLQIRDYFFGEIYRIVIFAASLVFAFLFINSGKKRRARIRKRMEERND